MKKQILISILVSLSLAIATPSAFSEALSINLMQATPVGSWQLREDTTTDHKGRQTVTQIRSSMIAEETRDGKKHFWIEMVMNSFKIKKGARKPSGDMVIMKSLVAESALQGDPANAVNNLRAFGKEIIIQTGDQDPIIIRGSGGMAESMMQAMGTKVSYSYSFVGDEDVTVKAGTFPARKIQGSGATEMKVVFRKISVTSNNTAWISDRVPFGMVKADGETVTNKKRSTHVSELLEYGDSGAVTLITKTPQELPEMPSLKNILQQ